jgi:hypothetical protein
MAKTNKKPQTSTISSRTSSADRSERTVALSGSVKSVESPKASVGAKKTGTSSPTYQQIADRAKEIWRKKGCQTGQDETNWYEAEEQLKRELDVR